MTQQLNALPVVTDDADAMVLGYASSAAEAIEVADKWLSRHGGDQRGISATVCGVTLDQNPDVNTEDEAEDGVVQAWLVELEEAE